MYTCTQWICVCMCVRVRKKRKKTLIIMHSKWRTERISLPVVLYYKAFFFASIFPKHSLDGLLCMVCV